MKKYKTDKTSVSGPINTIRLEGEINGIKKTVYLFMDIHLDPEFQTECEDINNYGVRKYIINQLNNAAGDKENKNIIFDFFHERRPLTPFNYTKKYKGRYIDEITKLFHKAINVDLKHNKILKSRIIPNARFHFIDIRGWFLHKFMDIYYELVDRGEEIIRNNVISSSRLSDINDAIKIIKAHFISIYKILYDNKLKQGDNNKKDTNSNTKKFMFTNNEEILSEYSDEEYMQKIGDVVYKLRHRYTNKNVMNKINMIIDGELKDNFKMFFEYADKSIKVNNEVIKFLQKYTKKHNEWIHNILIKQNDGTYDYGLDMELQMDYIKKVYITLSKFRILIIGRVGGFLMDIYFLRRLLDKDYIKNAIAYTGAHHSLNFIRLLVKYFDFNITHYSYLKNDDIDSATTFIKNSSNEDQLQELFYPVILKQCSDLTKFPKQFQ